MGSLFVAKVLMSMFEQPAKVPSDAELGAIVPGAWAAWARTNAGARKARTTATPAARAQRVPGARDPRLAVFAHEG